MFATKPWPHPLFLFSFPVFFHPYDPLSLPQAALLSGHWKMFPSCHQCGNKTLSVAFQRQPCHSSQRLTPQQVPQSGTFLPEELFSLSFYYMCTICSEIMIVSCRRIRCHRMAWIVRDLKDHQHPTHLPQAGLPTSISNTRQGQNAHRFHVGWTQLLMNLHAPKRRKKLWQGRKWFA